MNEPEGTRSVQLVRVLDAPIELVYRAWTEAEHVRRWMKCDADVELKVDGWQPRPGARFMTHMEKPGEWSATSTGRFLEVEPPRLLVYCTEPNAEMGTPGMTVRVELEPVEGGTRVTLTHSGIPTDDLCGIIRAGWTNSLGMLKDVVGAGERTTG